MFSNGIFVTHYKQVLSVNHTLIYPQSETKSCVSETNWISLSEWSKCRQSLSPKNKLGKPKRKRWQPLGMSQGTPLDILFICIKFNTYIVNIFCHKKMVIYKFDIQDVLLIFRKLRPKLTFLVDIHSCSNKLKTIFIYLIIKFIYLIVMLSFFRQPEGCL